MVHEDQQVGLREVDSRTKQKVEGGRQAARTCHRKSQRLLSGGAVSSTEYERKM